MEQAPVSVVSRKLAIPSIPVNTIATHEGVHHDEAVVILFFLLGLGEKKFPGSSKAKLEFWKPSDIARRFVPEQEMLKRGILCIGICGGRLDEHPVGKIPAKGGECAATLAAKELGIDREPSLQGLLKYSLRVDTTATAQPNDIATLMKQYHKQNPGQDEQLIEIVIPLLKAQLWVEKQFLACKEEIEGPNGMIDTFVDRKTRRELRIVAAVSDNTEFQRYARAVENCAVTIQGSPSTKQVRIYVDKKYDLNMDIVVARIRNAERETKSLLPIDDPEIICAEGKCRGAEEWYYHREGQFLLNGSLTATDIPPTKVPWFAIIDIVAKNIGRLP